ncbi:DUF2892 domain-containing protein [Weeksellaceae bacterium A-14]
MKKNMGTRDRTIRMVTAVVLALLYFTDTVSGTLGWVFIIIAAVFLLTSLVGYCPLYSLLGITTNRKR